MIFIHVLHSSLDEDDLLVIEKTVTSYGGALSSYHISADHDSETMVKKTRLPKETYYRLICMDYLPKYVKKVLYLDCDIIVNGSLKALYNTNLTNHMFAAAEDITEVAGKTFNRPVPQRAEASNYMPETSKYVNAGVLLMNLEYLRKVITTDEIVAMIDELGDLLVYHDQDFINYVFYKYTMYIDYKMYNYFPVYWDWDDLKPGVPVIIHFAGGFRPWLDDYFDNCKPYVLALNNKTERFVEQAKELYEKYAAIE